MSLETLPRRIAERSAPRGSNGGGTGDHPIHDDDPSEDFTPHDYEEMIDDLAEARRGGKKRVTADEP